MLTDLLKEGHGEHVACELGELVGGVGCVVDGGRQRPLLSEGE